MKKSTYRLSIVGSLISLFLFAQTGLAAESMGHSERKNSDMDKTMTDEMGAKPMGQQNDSKNDMMDHQMKNKHESQDMMKKMDSMDSDKMKMDQSMDMKKTYSVPTDAELRKNLTALQYRVTREEATEPAYNNTYWNNHEAGLYVDVISGVPLFSSADKYDSGTGWPSFTRPIDEDSVFVKEDRSFFMVRNEVRSQLSDAHLGHVFNDGPEPTGLRYCMNSAALRFIPVAKLEQEGYGDYVALFK